MAVAVLADSKGETGSIRPGRRKHRRPKAEERNEARTVKPVEGFGGGGSFHEGGVWMACNVYALYPPKIVRGTKGVAGGDDDPEIGRV